MGSSTQGNSKRGKEPHHTTQVSEAGSLGACPLWGYDKCHPHCFFISLPALAYRPLCLQLPPTPPMFVTSLLKCLQKLPMFSRNIPTFLALNGMPPSSSPNLPLHPQRCLAKWTVHLCSDPLPLLGWLFCLRCPPLTSHVQIPLPSKYSSRLPPGHSFPDAPTKKVTLISPAPKFPPPLAPSVIRKQPLPVCDSTSQFSKLHPPLISVITPGCVGFWSSPCAGEEGSLGVKVTCAWTRSVESGRVKVYILQFPNLPFFQ